MENTLALTLLLQTQAWALNIMKLASFLGTEEFFLLIMPAVYWCWDARLGFRLGMILVLSNGLCDSLKTAFHTPRPYWVSREVNAWGSETCFGLPSAHAQNAVAFWGLLAGYLKTERAWAAALTLSLIIGLSRIYLGVHFAEDVFCGWALGFLILGAFLFAEKQMKDRLAGLDLGIQIFVSLLASFGLLSLYALARFSMDGWQMPSSWASCALAATGNAIDPLNLKFTLTSAGMLFGLGAGYSLMRRRMRFLAPDAACRKATCYLLGMVGLLMIWYGLGELRRGQTAIVVDAIYYLRAALAGIWVAVLAPLLLVKVGLMEKGIDRKEK